VKTLALLVLLVPFAIGGSLYAARNYGAELATLHTTDADGRDYQNKVWILEEGIDLWIRANRPTRPWLDRIRDHPDVTLERRGTRARYRAVPLSHRRPQINALMAERYAWAEWLLNFAEDRAVAVPVRLERLLP
jgi:hypothetical protein